MGDDEVRVRHLPVDGEGGEEDAGEAADREHGEEAEGEEHRRVEDELPRQIVASQLKILTPVGTAIDHRREHEEDVQDVRQPDGNMWWAQTSIE